MSGLLIAIFLGWLGGYRFYKKQTGLGVVYLLTGGLFGIGWLVDIIIAAKNMKSSSSQLLTLRLKLKELLLNAKRIQISNGGL